MTLNTPQTAVPLEHPPDLRVALLGNVDSGKSTLVGVLSKGQLDDGRGHARSFVLQHRHEQEKGQTSAVALELMGFNDQGQHVLPTKITGRHNKDFYDVAVRSKHRITLVDLCGHEKYLKTTIFGLTGMLPDMALLIVSANNGVLKMTREHLGLSCALQVPVVVVVTKIDMCPKNVHQQTMAKVDRVLKVARKKKYAIRDENDVAVAAAGMGSNKVTPVFQISSVTGEGVDLLKQFLKTVALTGIDNIASVEEKGHSSQDEDEQEDTAEVHLDNVYMVQGVGLVLGGAVQSGSVSAGDKLMLGPDKNGEFRSVMVRSIFRQCVPTTTLYKGQQGTFAVKMANSKTKEHFRHSMFRKGMVLLSPAAEYACWEFEAKVKVLHHSTTISSGYSPIVHIGVVRQSAQIVSFTTDKDNQQDLLRTGNEAIVRFRFAYSPEYVKEGWKLIFREGTCKGVGTLTKVEPIVR